MEITVVDYQASWPDEFVKEQTKIQEIVKENAVAILHIGSTAVPNLKAKPIIDILLVVNDLTLLDEQAVWFEKLGYEYMGEFGLPGRRYMRKGGEKRSHQIHAYQFDSISEIQRHLAFRNYLRKHSDVAAAYGLLKADLAEKHPTSIEDYGDGKDAFVKQFEAEGLKEFWQSQQ